MSDEKRTYPGGYNQEAAAKLLSVVHELETRVEGGDPNAIPSLMDYKEAWYRPKVSREHLSQFIHNGDSPLAKLDMDELKQRIEDRRAQGKSTQTLERLVQELISLWRFAGELNNKYEERERKEPFLVKAGPAHRGPCEICGAHLDGVVVWRDPDRPARWCLAHGRTPDVAA